MRDVLTGPVGAFNGRVTGWLARIAAVALALIALLTFCDVIGRKIFSRGFTFTVEITEMTMALIVFLGVGLVTHERGHIVVDVVTLRLTDRIRIWLGFLINLLSLGFVVIMVWRLWLQATFILSKGDTTPVWNVPLWPIAFVIALGSLFFITALALHVVDSWQRATDPGKAQVPEPAARPFQE